MKDTESHVGEHHKADLLVDKWELVGEREEPGVVSDKGGHLILDRHVALSSGQKRNALSVKAPLRKHHHGDPVPVLVRYKQLRGLVKYHRGRVILRKERPKKCVGDGKHRQVLNVGVVVSAVCHNMMYVVRVFPPADANAVANIAGKEADDVVPLAVVCDACVAGIVADESCLLPERRDKDGRCKHVLLDQRKIHAQADEAGHQCSPSRVKAIVGLIQPGLVKLIHQLTMCLLVSGQLSVGSRLHVPNVKLPQHVPHVRRVVCVELVRHITASAEFDSLHTPWVFLRPAS
mmetsp:Transcript_26042/g.46310  ORF Transcript_26042/g.46310 Transcript_26042/m.46310 type:complete len:290 (-) Transcript_26042:284-1153(-)